MRIFSFSINGRRQYRVATKDSAGVVTSYLPKRLAHRMLRNLAV